jgi:hypothetical protein
METPVRYSSSPLVVLAQPITFRNRAKALTACSALLLGSVLVSVACRSTWQKVQELAPECRAGNGAACSRLVEIARSAGDWTDRRSAVDEITDQRVLAEIADSDI